MQGMIDSSSAEKSEHVARSSSTSYRRDGLGLTLQNFEVRKTFCRKKKEMPAVSSLSTLWWHDGARQSRPISRQLVVCLNQRVFFDVFGLPLSHSQTQAT